MRARTQDTFAKRWTGGVEIKTGDKVAKLTSIDTLKTGGVKKFPDGSESIKISLADFPQVSKRVIKPNTDSRKFRVRLNEDGDTVETVTPYSGVFRARATGLGPKTQDGEYRLIHKVFNEGTEKENHHDEFLCIYEIVEGVFRGVELPGFYIHYKFEEDPENEGFTRFNTADTPQAKQLHKLQGWAEVHGNILDEDVRWRSAEDGTILETLEERILENDREVTLVFEKGYIKTVQPVDDYGDEDDESESPDIEETQDKVRSAGRKNVPVEVEDDEPDFMKEPEVKSKSQARRVKAQKESSAKKPPKRPADDDDDL